VCSKPKSIALHNNLSYQVFKQTTMPHFWLVEELARSPQHETGLTKEGCLPSLRSRNPSTDREVRFDLNHVVHVVKGRRQMSPEEYQQKWNTKAEFAVIKAHNTASVKHHTVNDRLLKTDKYCIRGLEHRLRRARARRNAVRINSISAVLTEQARQKEGWKGGESDIRKIYREYNQSSAHDSHQQGLMDEREVRNNCDLPTRRHAVVLNDFNLKDLEVPEGEVEEEELSLEEVFPTSDDDSSSLLFQSRGMSFTDEYLDDFHDSILLLGGEEFHRGKTADNLSSCSDLSMMWSPDRRVSRRSSMY
jgi:hypothetical protein